MKKKLFTKSHSLDLLKEINNDGKKFTSKEHAYVIEKERYEYFESPASLLRYYLSINHKKLEALSFLIDYISKNKFTNMISFGAGQCVLEHLLGFVYPPHNSG